MPGQKKGQSMINTMIEQSPAENESKTRENPLYSAVYKAWIQATCRLM